ncbi:MAG: redoxin family protein [Armatimonadetes bacterium]|nr:redoxin family protein [Armatimonadota bacterium]
MNRLAWLLPLLLLTLSFAPPKPVTPRVARSGNAPSFAPRTIIVFLATDCPVASRTAPQIARLAKAFAKRGVRVVAVYPNALETDTDVQRHAKERGLTAANVAVVRDSSGNLARRFGASQSPESILLGAGGKIVYRGSVESLTRAVDALLAGKPVPAQTVRVAGCALRLPLSHSDEGGGRGVGIAYAKIAPLLAKHCVPCHRTGEVGAMPLDSPQSAASWARAMASYTKRREMPPWKADSHGEFVDERRLTDAEIAAFGAWAVIAPKAVAPALPVPVLVATPPAVPAWKAGTPDAVYEMPMPFVTPAEGRDVYQCFVLPTAHDADKWVSTIEFQPGNKRIVHHINVWMDTSGTARRLDASTDAPGYVSPAPGSEPGFKAVGVLGGWVPGHTPWKLPEGVGNRLPKGADIVLEVHYITTGKPETDRSRFGLTWLRGAVKKRLHTGEVSASGFTIPAGDRAYKISTSEFVREPITLLSVTPHMHNLGVSMRAVAELPDGTPLPLISVSNWDFAWQSSYRYKVPVRLPQNTRIDLQAVFDNSDANPKNPDRPPKPVKNGAKTTDEMCNLFIAYTVDGE